ncbi:MFS multidrug transporter [Cadophora sp. MPI-SDFR-AT-0126]|nr:MFS multidrug transporter [Leotiomycetes sp. MPI-SDFR-AT-0126]
MADSIEESTISSRDDNSGVKRFVAEKKDPTQEPNQNGPTVGDEEYITGLKRLVVVGACTMATFLLMLDISIVATAIPKIADQFHSLPDIGWYGSSYLLAFCAVQPLSGRIYNQFPTKLTYMTFIAIFELGSLLSGVADSSDMLIIGRAVAGIGASGLMNGGLTIIRFSVPMEKTASNLLDPTQSGLVNIENLPAAQLGILLGPLIGGALTEYATWRWCFYINLPLGALVVLALFFIRIPDHRVSSEIKVGLLPILHSFDLVGFAIFSGTAIMLLIAVEWGGNKYPWDSATIIGLFCGSASALVFFLFWEHRKGMEALLPLSILKQRIVWTSCLHMFFICANMMTTSYYMAVYFQAVRDKSPTMSGVYLLPSVLSQMAFGIIAGILVTRLGYYLPWAIASGALATIGTGLLTTLSPTTSAVRWIFFQIIAGAGRGMGLQMPVIAVQTSLPPSSISLGVTAVIFAQQLGPALFLSLAQTILSSTLESSLPAALTKLSDTANIPTSPMYIENIIDAGATGFRNVVSGKEVGAVVSAYCEAVDRIFYMGTGAAGCAFLVALGMGWRSVKIGREKEDMRGGGGEDGGDVEGGDAGLVKETRKAEV